MKLVIQRVSQSYVTIDNQIHGSIDKGCMVLVGIGKDDEKSDVVKVINKLINLRIFEDDHGKMNLSLLDIKGSILSISQFTLYSDCKKGRRPSFINAAKPEKAKELYDYFNAQLKEIGIQVEQGIFGANMMVNLINDGPVTIILNSEELS